MKVRKITRTAEATKWLKMGDHKAVIPIPSNLSDFIPVHEGATGFLPEGGQFVFEGDWILDFGDDEYSKVKEDKFREHFEEIG